MLLLSFPVCVLYLPSSSSLSRWAFCRPSGMVAPHLTACLRNDKAGEAPPPQSQTTVCNCRPLLSGSSFFCPSRSLCGGRGSCCSTSCAQIHSPAPTKEKKIHCQRRRRRCCWILEFSSRCISTFCHSNNRRVVVLRREISMCRTVKR